LHEDQGRELDEPLSERRSQNPRAAPGREPAGAATTRRLVALVAAVVALATAVLILMLLPS
jgi:hypothetical protein